MKPSVLNKSQAKIIKRLEQDLKEATEIALSLSIKYFLYMGTDTRKAVQAFRKKVERRNRYL